MVRVALASAIAVILASGSALAAPAATLSGISGSVMIDSGNGFQKVSSSISVDPGSRVLVSKGGSAVLAYAAGCSKSLSSNTITTVAGADACAQPVQVASQNSDNRWCKEVRQGEDEKWYCTVWGVGIPVGITLGGVLGYAIGQSSSSDEVVFVPISR